MKQTVLKKEEQVLVPTVYVARSFFSRFLGLMGRKSIPSEEALLFPRCNSIHTFFMRFPIDVIFVSKDGTVVDVIEKMKAWRMCLPRGKASHTLEMRGDRARELGIVPGVRLNLPEGWN